MSWWTHRPTRIALHGRTEHGSTQGSCLRTRLHICARKQRLVPVARRGRRQARARSLGSIIGSASSAAASAYRPPHAGHHIQPQIRVHAAPHQAIVHSPAARRPLGSGRILIGKAIFHRLHGEDTPPRSTAPASCRRLRCGRHAGTNGLGCVLSNCPTPRCRFLN
ncbi:hypothetical protein FMO13_14570 [Xanthomonas phaseoli pv. dieffenbachiae]